MCLAGAAKLATAGSGRSDFLSVGLGIVEILVGGMLLWRRFVHGGMIMASGIALVGGLQAILFKEQCRCFGTLLILGWKAHLVLCCVVGILVAVGGRSLILRNIKTKKIVTGLA